MVWRIIIFSLGPRFGNPTPSSSSEADANKHYKRNKRPRSHTPPQALNIPSIPVDHTGDAPWLSLSK